MNDALEFDLNLWDLKRHPLEMRAYFQAAFQHNINLINNHYKPDWLSLAPKVDIVHLFACGYPRDGGMFRSRDVLNQILDHGVRLDRQDAYGWLSINYACYFGHPATLDLLLEAGSPVQNPGGPEPLDSALTAVAQHDQSSAETCAKYLLFHDADPNKGLSSDPQWGGVTWLVWALINERFEWAEILWRRGLISLSDREKQLLLLRAPSESLAWAEYRGFGIMNLITPRHSAFAEVLCARSRRESDLLRNLLSEKLNEEDEEKGRRKI